VRKEDSREHKNLRLYRTGDLGRYLSDGNIEFLGRIDDQVKIRGYRIELGEIESVLSGYKGVHQVTVAAREDGSGNKRLVAYVVREEGGEGSEAEFVTVLKTYSANSLPEYMIPSQFVFLEALPLTPSGKVDRKSLPEPEVGQRQVEGTYVSPRTEIEKQLAEIWSQLLRIEQIGIHDNFFQVGGHSLLAIQIVSRIRAIYNVEVSLRVLFESPTIIALAAHIEQLRQESEDQVFMPPIYKRRRV